MPKKTEKPIQIAAPEPQAPPLPSSHNRESALKAIGAELRAARERSGMSIMDLHRQTGISRTVLQGYEASRFAPGTIELKKVCEVLRVTPNRVLFGLETPLEERPLLESYVGDLSKATSIARLAIIFQMLTTNEIAAVLTLIESLATPRIGGAEHMKIAMDAVALVAGDGVLTLETLERFGDEAMKNVPAEKLAELERRAEALNKKTPKRVGKS